MAVYQAFSRILGHKHLIKTFTEKTVILVLILMTVIGTAVPGHVLAFETELNISPAASLEASIQALRNEEFAEAAEVVYEVDYSDRLAGSVVSLAALPVNNSPLRAPKTPRIAARSDNVLVLQGTASYYSWAGCLGCNPARIMANGQVLNDNALTMAIGAHLSYLVGHKARVTNIHTGQSIDVLITDTGGFYQEKYGQRVADLTIATKQAIGMTGGLGQVRVEVY